MMENDMQDEHQGERPPLESPEIPKNRAGGDFVLSRRVAAAILAILLGWLGVHKFYLHEIALGILYAAVSLVSCFSLVAVVGAVGIIEGILYLTMTEDEFNLKYPAR